MRKHFKANRIAMMAFTSIVLCCVIVTTPVFAANTIITGWDGDPGTHQITFTANKTTVVANQIRLNCYTNGTPGNGTRVTTWKYTGDLTQAWGLVYPYGAGNYGGDCYANMKNPQVCLNINRAQSMPEVNVALIYQNRFADVLLFRGGSTVYVKPRYNHSSNMYLQSTSAISGAGGGTYVRWNTSGSTFYRYDISSGIYS